MTLPSEQVYALKATREFLRELLSGKAMKVSVIRARAGSCLRHYPHDYEIRNRWSASVCDHGQDREFCQICQKDAGSQ